MAMQILLDSLSRCFMGSARSGGLRSAVHEEEEMARRESVARSSSNLSDKNRGAGAASTRGGAQRRARSAIGMSLKDKEFDALFENDHRQSSSGSRNRGADGDGGAASQRRQMPDMEFDYAEVLARARCAAHPTWHRTPTSAGHPRRRREARRRSPGGRVSDIFRSKELRGGGSGRHTAKKKKRDSTASLSSVLMGNDSAMALCFATPIRDEEDEEEGEDMTAEEQTLNTCDDTMTSTVMLEAKYGHITEKTPSMPLFRQFEVDVTEEKTDELRKIVASHSHKSTVNVIQIGDKKRRGRPREADRERQPAKEEKPAEETNDPHRVSAGEMGKDGDATPSRRRPPNANNPHETSPSTPPRHPFTKVGKNEKKGGGGGVGAASNDNRKMSTAQYEGAVPSLKVLSESSQSTTQSTDPSNDKSSSG